MYVLVTGSRDWPDPHAINTHLRKLWEEYPGAILLHGNARGADQIAALLWKSWGGAVEPHGADWRRYGKRAGHIRNARMIARHPVACLAFIRDESPGATNCAKLADRAGIPVRRVTMTGAA